MESTLESSDLPVRLKSEERDSLFGAVLKNKMKGFFMKPIAVLFSLLFIASTIFAQGMEQRRQFYDPTKVTTIIGTIASVDSQETPRGDSYMVRLTVQDTSGTTPVMVGPSSYLDSQNITFNKGDSIQVTGAKMNFRGNDVFIAGQIITGGKTIKLRDDSGRPVWMGQMR